VIASDPVEHPAASQEVVDVIKGFKDFLLRGNVVDVLAAAADGDARLVASAVRVLVVPRAAPDRLGLGTGDGALLLVLTTSATAERLAAAAVSDRLSIVIRGS
jgi:hypothetical protein